MASALINIAVSPNPVPLDQALQVQLTIWNWGNSTIQIASMSVQWWNSSGQAQPAVPYSSNNSFPAGPAFLPGGTTTGLVQGTPGIGGSGFITAGSTVTYNFGITRYNHAIGAGTPGTHAPMFSWLTCLVGFSDGTTQYPVAPAQVTVQRSDNTNSGSEYAFAYTGGTYRADQLYNAPFSYGILNYDLSQPSNLMTWSI